MVLYSFTTALVGGGVPPAIAAAETQADSTIAAAKPLQVGAFEAGGRRSHRFLAGDADGWGSASVQRDYDGPLSVLSAIRARDDRRFVYADARRG
jgi:hypothetical protein